MKLTRVDWQIVLCFFAMWIIGLIFLFFEGLLWFSLASIIMGFCVWCEFMVLILQRGWPNYKRFDAIHLSILSLHIIAIFSATLGFVSGPYLAGFSMKGAIGLNVCSIVIYIACRVIRKRRGSLSSREAMNDKEANHD